MKLATVTYNMGGFDPLKPDGNVAERKTLIIPGLSTDRTVIPPDNTTFATCHYAGTENTATWNVNGVLVTEATALVGGLRVSELEVTAAAVGNVTVSCNGSSIVLEAR